MAVNENSYVHEPSPTQEHVGIAQPHTPGPWEVSILTRALVVANCGNGNVRNVALALQSEHELVSRDYERQANARLIAAAPDLLEALRFYANPEIYKPHPHGLAFDDRDLSYRAKGAIAKALSDGRSDDRATADAEPGTGRRDTNIHTPENPHD